MTLLDKDLPAPADEKHGVDAAIPPSYADTVGAGPSSPPGPAASNFASVQTTHNKISGRWTVNTDLEVPLALLRPLGPDETERPSLSLRTTYGSLDAEVVLVSGSRQTATLNFEVGHGKMQVKLISRVNAQPFKLKAKGSHANVTIALPPDFVGPLRHRTATIHGKVKYSEALQSRLVTFTEEISFVGDWKAAGFVDFEQWKGDEAEVEITYGKIHFVYSDGVGVHTGEPVGNSRRPDEGGRLRKRGGFFGRRRGREHD